MTDREETNVMDLAKMKVADLKRELKSRGLSTVGNKNELIERLQSGAAVNSSRSASDMMDDTGNNEESEFLDEDDLDGLDDELSVEGISANDGDTSVISEIKSPQAAKKDEPNGEQQQKHVSKRKLTAVSSKKSEPISQQSKKFVLNRNTSWSNSVTSEKENQDSTTELEKHSTTNAEETEANASDAPAKKVIKLSGLTMKERLEMRAQKFGIQTPETTTAKKLARAIRFGMGPSSVPVASTEVLKKRAERFGTATSPILKKTELDEKLKLRQERFGAVTTLNKANLEEKRRLRAERFKLQAA